MVQAERLSYNFGSNWALKDVSFSLEKGDFLFLTGPSGAGKTTLMRLLYGELSAERSVCCSVAGFDLKRLKKRQIPHLRRQIGVVFQDFKILPRRTVAENVALALEVQGMPQQQIERRVRAVLRVLGVESKAYVPCERLSGGEQQRVAIARSVVGNPQLILADEPTGNLDPDLSKHLMKVFRQFHAYGTTVIMATHSYDLIRTIPGAKVLHLSGGQALPEYCTVNIPETGGTA